MERLYYETKKNPLQPKAVAGTSQDRGEYLTKVATLIPSEIIAGYLTMFGLAGAIKNINVQTGFYWVVFGAGLILTPIYLNSVATPNKPKRNHLIISTISFIVWSYVTTGLTLSETIAPGIYDSAIASIILVLFSLISGIIPLDK